MPEQALQREIVLAALERLLAWPEMLRSPQLSRFLDYIVRRTLDGEEASIKAYSIAVDVLGRAADFDPQTDPIVRVQARRLRSLLGDYYRGDGAAEAVQISLPVGRYIPVFAPGAGPSILAADEPAPEALPPPSLPTEARGGLPPTWYGLAILALSSAIAALMLSTWQPPQGGSIPVGAIDRPVITVFEFQNLAGHISPPPQVAGLAIELVTDLEQFRDIDVRYGGGGESNVAVSGLPSGGYVLSGIVRWDGDIVQYSAILTDSASGQVVWDQTLPVERSVAASPDVVDTVSNGLSLILGSPRGPLHAGARSHLAAIAPSNGVESAYICRVLFDSYRESGDAGAAARARACFSELPGGEALSGDTVAAMASLDAEIVDPALPGEDDIDRSRQSLAALEEAISLDPVSSFVWEQLGRFHERQGASAQALADYRSAIQLNAANADALAASARLMGLQGDLAGAEMSARTAVEQTPESPAWYWGVPALIALRDGDDEQALLAAERYAAADRELGPILAIMAGQGAGNSNVVNRYLPQVLELSAFRAEGIMPRLARRIADPQLLEAISIALLAAGAPAVTLSAGF